MWHRMEWDQRQKGGVGDMIGGRGGGGRGRGHLGGQKVLGRAGGGADESVMRRARARAAKAEEGERGGGLPARAGSASRVSVA